MKKLFLFLSMTTLMLNSCSKKDEPVTQTACLEDSYSGDYLGTDGNFPTDTNIAVKLTKTGCATATLESTKLGNKNVKEIGASGSGGYVGKLDDGSGVNIAVNNGTLTITCTGYSYSGTKQ